jgi:hypothetical protein
MKEKNTSQAILEHLNISVSDAKNTAQVLCRLFDWQIRWSGTNSDNQFSCHVGTAQSYLALYTPLNSVEGHDIPYQSIGRMNHVGVVVDDISEIKKRVEDEGLVVHHEADYEPGRRFYFNLDDAIEVEVVSYS